MLNALSGAMIKIETYWNVNSVPAAPCLHPADLNRDILER